MKAMNENFVLAAYPVLRRGKVRDVFDLGDHLLLVASDRISAFDVVLPSPLPGKGALLTRISRFWFETIAGTVPTQLSELSLDDLNLSGAERDYLQDRAMIVRKAERIDIECVARAFLAGSAWKEYQASGTVAEVQLPSGLQRGDRLPTVLFTPAIKNDSGHDENISVETLRNMVGTELANQLEQRSLELFDVGSRIAAEAGFLLADSKFEYGWIDGELAVIDEIFTPDSSRYWDAAAWQPGTEPPSFDKQIIRDWLEASGWNKQPPGPELPGEIVNRALDRYAAVADRLQATTHKER